jgi:hypothetical protein
MIGAKPRLPDHSLTSILMLEPLMVCPLSRNNLKVAGQTPFEHCSMCPLGERGSQIDVAP